MFIPVSGITVIRPLVMGFMLVVLLMTTLGAEAGGTTYEVPLDGDIHAVIDEAESGDTILLMAGVYELTSTIDPAGKSITLLGATDSSGAPASILDGGHIDGTKSGIRILICQSGEQSDTTFQNLVIQNGYDHDCGGGMSNKSFSKPTLKNCTFQNNIAGNSGGGIHNDSDGELTLKNCRFDGNHAAEGGAIYSKRGALNLMDCDFTGNTSEETGGAIHLFANRSLILGCKFNLNTTEDEGGALYCDTSETEIDGCMFTANSADSGGGASAYKGSFTSTNSTYSKCQAGIYGGALNVRYVTGRSAADRFWTTTPGR